MYVLLRIMVLRTLSWMIMVAWIAVCDGPIRGPDVFDLWLSKIINRNGPVSHFYIECKEKYNWIIQNWPFFENIDFSWTKVWTEPKSGISWKSYLLIEWLKDDQLNRIWMESLIWQVRIKSFQVPLSTVVSTNTINVNKTYSDFFEHRQLRPKRRNTKL